MYNEYDPYDDYCGCEDADINPIDGQAHCYRCGRHWTASTEEINREIEFQRQYYEWEERQHRRERLSEIWERIKSAFRFRRRRPEPETPDLDDEIPF